MLYSVTMQVTSLLVLLSVTTVTLCIAEKVNNATITYLSQTDYQLNAKFIDSTAKLGIAVSSSEQSLLVTSLFGKVLVSFKQPFYEEDDGEGLDQLVVIHGRPFLDHRRRNKASSYSITDEEAEELMAAAELKSNEDKIGIAINNIIQGTPSKETELLQQQTLRNTITDLINDPHTPVIINAAITMGEKEGIIGHDYPPVLPFYNLARVLSHIRNNPVLMDTSFAMSIDKKKKINPKKECNKNKSCYYKCPPCKKHECVGMCGAECSCWKWVCDTCCWQKGCCLHDYCCEKHGFFSVACFNVTKLKCNSFKCPK